MSKSAPKISNPVLEISLQQVVQYPIAKQDFWASFATILNIQQQIQALMVVAFNLWQHQFIQ